MNQKIREYREKLSMTQAELAEKLGIRQSAIAMWENGTRFPRADKLPQLARLLGCTIDELFEKGD